MLQEVVFGIIPDLHVSDGEDYSLYGGYRRVTSWVDRFGEFITDCNAYSPALDFAFSTGDFLDGVVTTDYRGQLQAGVSQSGDLNVPFAQSMGNHENGVFTGANGNPTIANYFTDVNGNHLSRSNGFPSAGEPRSYTFDVKGIRFVVLFAPLNKVPDGTGEEDDHVGWLEARLGETDMPIVIFTHTRIGIPVSDGGGNFQASNHAAVRQIIDAVPNVQVCFNGHWHPGDEEEYGGLGIHFFSFHGSVLAPQVEDNSYYIIQLRVRAVKYNNFRDMANIKITGYDLGSDSTRPYMKYAVI